jgi:hypothetical protein
LKFPYLQILRNPMKQESSSIELFYRVADSFKESTLLQIMSCNCRSLQNTINFQTLGTVVICRELLQRYCSKRLQQRIHKN